MKQNLFKVEAKFNSKNNGVEMETSGTDVFTEMLEETDLEKEFMDIIDNFSEKLGELFDRIDEKLEDVIEEEN